MALNNPYLDRISFWWKSKPKSFRFAGVGFTFLIMTTILVNFIQNNIILVWVAMMGLLGLVLFFMGVIYGITDFYRYFRRKTHHDT